MDQCNEIFVPVDGSEGSQRAVRFAAWLAGTIKAPVTLAYVVPLTPESVMAIAKMTKAQIKTLQKDQADSVLVDARAAVEGTGVEVAELVMTGDAAEEILGYVDKHPNALVVMSRRGLSPVKRLLVGSVSEKVTRYSRGPVTLVN